MSASAFDEFVAPWRAAFPALALAEVYASRDEASKLLARSVLVMEWCDTVWRSSDERVTAAKLGWWAEEWQRISSGTSRHPISARLQIEGKTAPLRGLLCEHDSLRVADWAGRIGAYRAIGSELAEAFGRVDTALATAFTVLATCRHLAAVWSAQPAALSCLPLDVRAHHQIRSAAPDAASAQQAAIQGAEHAVKLLGTAFAAIPRSEWMGQRGARVLTAIALRELRRLGQPASRLDAWGNGISAWRAARGVD